MAAVRLRIVSEADAVSDLIVGKSPQIQSVRDLVRRVATSDASVMITGPSGAGKEVVARAIHAASGRSDGPFVAINCGAIPPELIESELFGHERGSFTGAHARRLGRFEEADGGTLFLDEIGDMRFDMQVKLLRVLEERLVSRIGGGAPVKVDVRIVCATHQNIEEAIAQNKFRQDLYYRLSVLPINVPGLAEHADDVPLLISHFQRQTGTQQRADFAPEAMRILQQHAWTGNVRELRNVVERSTVLFGGSVVRGDDVEQLLGINLLGHHRARTAAFPAEAAVQMVAPSSNWDDGTAIDLKACLEEMELARIQDALAKAEGVVSEAARLLTLKRTTLIEKMRKYALDRA